MIGCYESGVDAAYNLAKRGKRVALLDSGQDQAKTYDPSRVLSPYTAERLQSMANMNLVELIQDFKVEKEFIICLVSGDKRCSLNKLKKIVSKKDVSMASAEEVKAQTGFTIGGVSPVGHINDLNIIIDRSLERFQIVYAAAGHPNSIFKIDISKLKDLTKGRVEDITE